MVYRAYCYQTRRVTPLLDEEEWQGLHPLLGKVTQGVIAYRRETGVDLTEALEQNPNARAAMDYYTNLTGEMLDSVNQLRVARLALYGRHCPTCEKPFRTPRAKLCAECGYQLPAGEVAGPLVPMEKANEPT